MGSRLWRRRGTLPAADSSDHTLAVIPAAPQTGLPPGAGVGRRATAAIIDLGIVVAGEIVALLLGGSLIQASGVSAADLRTGHVGVAAGVARAFTQSALFFGPGVYLYVGWRRGGTVGMRARQCSLRSSDLLTPPTTSQVLLRLCGLWFSLASAGLGLIWGLTRSDRRGWPDLFARTTVVHTPRWPVWATTTWAGSPGGAPGQAGWPGASPSGWLSHPAWPSPAPWPPQPAWPPSPPPLPPPVSGAPAAPSAAPWGWQPAVEASTAPAVAPASLSERAPWTWTDVVPVLVLLLPLSLGVQYVTVAALKWLLGGVALATRRPIEALASSVTAYGAVFLLVLLFVRLRRHAPLASLGLRRAEWRWLLAALPFAFAAFLLESVSGLLSQSLFPQAPANQCVDIRRAFAGALWLAIIAVAVVAPLVEEIVFRGMVFGWLRGRLPLAWAVVVSASLFSLEHISFLQLTLFLPVFTTGLVLAVLYHHARSIWPTVLVHGTFNLVATLVLFNSLSC